MTMDKSSKDFKQFDSLLATPYNKGAAMCLGCSRYAGDGDAGGAAGRRCGARLEAGHGGQDHGLRRLWKHERLPGAAGVAVGFGRFHRRRWIFRKSDAATKGDTATFAGVSEMSDPVAVAKKSADALGTSPAGPQA